MKTLFLLVALFNGDCDGFQSPDRERYSHAHVYQFETYDECSGTAEGLLSQGNDCRLIHACYEVDRVVIDNDTPEATD